MIFFLFFLARRAVAVSQRSCAQGALGARRLSATEMASPSAVVWLQPVQRRQREHHAAAAAAQRTQIRAAAAVSRK